MNQQQQTNKQYQVIYFEIDAWVAQNILLYYLIQMQLVYTMIWWENIELCRF